MPCKKRRICAFHAAGSCFKGSACDFIHEGAPGTPTAGASASAERSTAPRTDGGGSSAPTTSGGGSLPLATPERNKLFGIRQQFEACTTRDVVSWMDVVWWLHNAYALLDRQPEAFRCMILGIAASSTSAAGPDDARTTTASLQQLCRTTSTLHNASAQVQLPHQVQSNSWPV
jgi:hypothetical protein